MLLTTKTVVKCFINAQSASLRSLVAAESTSPAANAASKGTTHCFCVGFECV